jgi:hypothetical protein
MTAGAGTEELLLEDQSDKLPTSWSSDGRFLLFEKAERETRTDLWVLELSSERKPFPYDYAVSADGQRFFVNSAAETTGVEPMTVIVNWIAGLPKQ